MPEPSFDGQTTTYHLREQSVHALRQYSKLYQTNINNNYVMNSQQQPQQQQQQYHEQFERTCSKFLIPAGPSTNTNKDQQSFQRNPQKTFMSHHNHSISPNSNCHSSTSFANGIFSDYNNSATCTASGYYNSNINKNSNTSAPTSTQPNPNQLKHPAKPHHQMSYTQLSYCSVPKASSDFNYTQAGVFII